MSKPSTITNFTEWILQSGLLTEAQLRTQLRSDETLENPEVCARRLVKARLLTPFQARSLLQGRYRGFFIAKKYKVLENLGEGGMGRVILCEHLILNRLVALKMLRPTSEPLGGIAERFLREAQASAALNHPNIVRVFDADIVEKSPIMVMEYLDGATLHQLVAQHGALPVGRAAEYLRQAATGLAHAHSLGQVHRDVKPSNILVERSGTVKLLDLGLVRFFDTDRNAKLTQRFDDNAILGTADFIAPEQAMDSSSADPRADIYSLGYTLYFLLTGRTPFEDATTQQKLLFHQLRDPKPLREVRPELPEGIVDLFQNMTRKSPDDRIQTADEVATLLETFADPKTSIPTPNEMPKIQPRAFVLGLVPAEAASRMTPDNPSSLTRTSPAASSSSVHDSMQTPSASRAATTSDLPITSASPSDILPAKLPPIAKDFDISGSGPSMGSPATSTLPASSRVSRRTWILLGSGLALGLMAILGLMRTPSASNPPKAAGDFQSPFRPDDASNPIPPSAARFVLRSGGSTFIQPLMMLWIEKYQERAGISISYDGGGSSSAIRRVTDGALNFGCTDAPMTDEQLRNAQAEGGEILHVPLVMGAVVPTYNLPDLKKPLVFPGSVLADIYLGKVTLWNDDSIQLNNPGVELPNLPIVVVRRSDGSGTTFIWTDYLSQVSDEWRRAVGANTQPKWPIGASGKALGFEGKGNDGLAQEVKNHLGAIGYVELTFALRNNLPAGWVLNRQGRPTAPTIENVTAAVTALLGGAEPIPADLRYSLTNGPGANSYPISGTTWAIFYAKQPPEVKDELVRFLRWATTVGQPFAKDLKCAALPAELGARIEAKLAKVTAK